MDIFFWVCFGVGVGYTVIAFLLGEIFHFGGFGGHADGVDGIDGIDGVDGGDAGGDFDAGTVSPLKPAVVAAFITVFGGAGLLLGSVLPIFMVITASASIAAVVAFIIYRFVIIPLYRAQNTSAVDIQSLIGTKAEVTEKILKGGYGQISYKANGNTYNSPAKAEDGGSIERHAVVEIMYIQNNTYYVRGKN